MPYLNHIKKQEADARYDTAKDHEIKAGILKEQMNELAKNAKTMKAAKKAQTEAKSQEAMNSANAHKSKALTEIDEAIARYEQAYQQESKKRGGIKEIETELHHCDLSACYLTKVNLAIEFPVANGQTIYQQTSALFNSIDDYNRQTLAYLERMKDQPVALPQEVFFAETNAKTALYCRGNLNNEFLTHSAATIATLVTIRALIDEMKALPARQDSAQEGFFLASLAALQVRQGEIAFHLSSQDEELAESYLIEAKSSYEQALETYGPLSQEVALRPIFSALAKVETQLALYQLSSAESEEEERAPEDCKPQHENEDEVGEECTVTDSGVETLEESGDEEPVPTHPALREKRKRQALRVKTAFDESSQLGPSSSSSLSALCNAAMLLEGNTSTSSSNISSLGDLSYLSGGGFFSTHSWSSAGFTPENQEKQEERGPLKKRRYYRQDFARQEQQAHKKHNGDDSENTRGSSINRPF